MEKKKKNIKYVLNNYAEYRRGIKRLLAEPSVLTVT